MMGPSGDAQTKKMKLPDASPVEEICKLDGHNVLLCCLPFSQCIVCSAVYKLSLRCILNFGPINVINHQIFGTHNLENSSIKKEYCIL